MLPYPYEVAAGTEGARRHNMVRVVHIVNFAWREMQHSYACSQARTLSLQSDIKNFKRRTRKVAMHCVNKEDEWNFHTCGARRS